MIRIEDTGKKMFIELSDEEFHLALYQGLSLLAHEASKKDIKVFKYLKSIIVVFSKIRHTHIEVKTKNDRPSRR